MEWLELGVVAGAFATWVTAHVTLAWGLFTRGQRLNALLAFLVLPLAPYWGWGARLRIRSVLWMASLLVYLLLGVVRGAYVH
ncbi:MAG: hypothetical protein SFV15_05170 [Polyangiaceae bacterium]|nr:hypothetical protein [Polyangiaceae bacterium]